MEMNNYAGSTEEEIPEQEILDSSFQEVHPAEENEHFYSLEYKYHRPVSICRDPFLLTGMMEDVLLNNLEKLSRKINSGSCVEMVDFNKKSLLHFAVQAARDDTSMIDFLLQQEKIDINAADNNNITPLMESILQDNSLVAIHLIKKGANVNFPVGCTPLHLSVERGLTEIAEALIQAGADLNALNIYTNTPLQLSVNHRQFEMMCLLLYYGVEMRPHAKFSPFTTSIWSRRFEFADVLLEYETEFDSLSLEYAIIYKYPNLERLLIKIVEEDENFCFFPGLECLSLLSRNVTAWDFVWKNFDVDPQFEPHSLFNHSITANDDDFGRILDIMKGQAVIMKLVKYSTYYPFLCSVIHSADHKPNVDYHEISALFLSYGLVVWDTDFEAVYQYFGFCELFQLMLHMEIKLSNESRRLLVPYLYYSVDDTISFRDLVVKLLIEDRYRLSSREYQHLRRLTILPPIKNLDEIVSSPVVLKLTELARNVVRRQLCVENEIKNTKQFYSTLNILPIPLCIKKIISLEIFLYD